MYMYYFHKNKNYFGNTNSMWACRQEVGEHSNRDQWQIYGGENIPVNGKWTFVQEQWVMLRISKQYKI